MFNELHFGCIYVPSILDFSRCISSCGCDYLFQNLNSPSEQDQPQEEVDPEELKHDLLKLKEEWLEYKRAQNKLKKQERQINQMNKHYQEFLESAEHAGLNQEDCDMHCAHQCIKEWEEVAHMVDCMYNECDCDFYFDVQQILEDEEDTGN
jgi:hypothetical protein